MNPLSYKSYYKPDGRPMVGRSSYTANPQEITCHKRPWSFLDWFLVMGLIVMAVLGIVFGSLFFFPAQAQGQEDIKLCGLMDVVCPGEIAPPIKKVRYEEAYVTYYSKGDSCHYPDGKGGCLVASGNVAKEGIVACERSLALGAEIWIGNEKYTCEDRYSEYLDEVRDRPTVDVWTSKSSSWARQQGIHKEIIGIVE